MKSKFLFFVCALFLLNSCKRDQVERTDILNTVDTPIHCINGELDEDEIGLDCGGSCLPCDSLTPSCSPEFNQLIFDGNTYDLVFESDSLGDVYFAKATFENGKYYIKVTTREFDPSLMYISDCSGFHDLSVEIYYPFSPGYPRLVSLCDASIFMHVVNNQRSFTICGGDYYSHLYNRDFTLESMNLTISN